MYCEWIEAAEKDDWIIVFLADLSAAFDTLTWETLLAKMKLYGLDDLAIKWFTSFLTGRTQAVQIGQETSQDIALSKGSPQGSLLSPLLFIIYVADLPLWIGKASAYSYADDTSLSVVGRSLEEVKGKAEAEVDRLMQFMAANSLVANPDKSGLLVVKGRGKRGSSEVSLKIGEHQLRESKTEKLLGLRISSDLKWREHMAGKGGICSAIRSGIFAIRRLMEVLPRRCLARVADSLILSKVRYGLEVYGTLRLTEEGQPVEAKRVQVLLNDLMRLLTGTLKKDRVSLEALAALTGFQSFNQMAGRAALAHAWKIINELCTANKDLLRRIPERSTMVTKAMNRGDVVVPGGSRRRQRCFTNRAAVLWNESPEEVRLAVSKAGAKKAIKTFSCTLPY